MGICGAIALFVLGFVVWRVFFASKIEDREAELLDAKTKIDAMERRGIDTDALAADDDEDPDEP
jgi:hypothetical protein